MASTVYSRVSSPRNALSRLDALPTPIIRYSLQQCTVLTKLGTQRLTLPTSTWLQSAVIAPVYLMHAPRILLPWAL